MGARMGYVYQMTVTSVENMKSQGIDVTATAKFKDVASVSTSLGVGNTNTNTSVFSNSVLSTKQYSLGLPPAGGNVNQWSNTAITTPMPISYNLNAIQGVFNPTYFNLSQLTAAKINITTLQAQLTIALNSYCADYLMAQKKLPNCNGPAPDPASYYFQTVTLTANTPMMLKNIGYGTCMDFYSGSWMFYLNACNAASPSQQFELISAVNPSNYYYVLHVASGAVIGSSGDVGYIHTYLVGNVKSTSGNQKWTLSGNSSNYYTFKNYGEGYCMDIEYVGGSNIPYTNNCSSSTNQQYQFMTPHEL